MHNHKPWALHEPAQAPKKVAFEEHYRGHVPEGICPGRWVFGEVSHACSRREWHLHKCTCWCGSRCRITER